MDSSEPLLALKSYGRLQTLHSMAESSGPTISEKPVLLVTWFCPFAQRTWIASNIKAVEHGVHELTHDELYNKPKWFLDINPEGLIPAIAYIDSSGAQRVITESLLCNEWLEDAFPDSGNSLLPPDAFGRFSARSLIDRFGSKFVPEFYRLLVRKGEDDRTASKAAIDKELQRLVDHADKEGPYLLGNDLTLADCAICPFLLRLPILQHYRGYKPSSAAVADWVSRYVAAVGAHPGVAATMVHPEGKDYHVELLGSYERYADGTAGSMMARDAAQS